MQDLISKANTLLEALPYIQKFSGATFVIKYGGSFMDSPDPQVRQTVARDLVFLEAVEINPIVVHGGGKAITRAMESSGLKAQFVQGQRITDEATAEIVDRVLSREINPEVVSAIKSLGGAAKGFSGPSIFKCRKARMDGPGGQQLDIGFVGEVTGVNTAPLLECIAHQPLSRFRRKIHCSISWSHSLSTNRPAITSSLNRAAALSAGGASMRRVVMLKSRKRSCSSAYTRLVAES